VNDEQDEDEEHQQRGVNNEQDEAEQQQEPRGVNNEQDEDEQQEQRGANDEEDEDEQQEQRGANDEQDQTEEGERAVEDDKESTLEERLAHDGLEITTGSMTTFGKTSSTVAAHLYTPEPVNSSVVAFSKYTGLLTDKKPLPKKTGTSKQAIVKPYPIDKPTATEHVDDESNAPMAQQDQNPEKSPNLKSNKFVLENNGAPVQKRPLKTLTTTPVDSSIKVPAAPLAQGEQPVQPEETKSNN